MTDASDRPDPEETPERRALREQLAEALRQAGRLAPVTDEELDAFERALPPAPPLEPSFVAKTTASILQRIRDGSPRPRRVDRLWQDRKAEPRKLVGMHRNAGDEVDPDAEAKLEAHRRELRKEAESEPESDPADNA
ncbi:MAG: hypothetical protein M9894_17640 [Planctomycetes bacterium]|nr:hypothetical protein [Planctomycetota bacterium]